MANKADQMQLEEVAAQIQRALLLAEQGDLIGAEALYHKVLELQPDHPQALYGLAQLAGAIDDQEVKEILLSQAIEQLVAQADLGLQSLVALWLTELAEVLFKLNRPVEAMDCLEQCEDLIAESLKAPSTR
jgi:tetratricopeptide (TPR) repeat protein